MTNRRQGGDTGNLWTKLLQGYTDPVAADTGGSGGGQAAAGGNKIQLLQAVNSDGSLSTQDRNAILAWLNGDALADPRLSAWVLRNSPGGLPSGAGILQGAQAQAQQGQGTGWQSATANGAPAAGAAGGLPPGDYAFSQQADPAAAPLPPTGGNPPTGGGNPVTGPGGLPGELAAASLWENQKGQANRYAARAAGIDSDQGGIASDYFSHYTDPLIKALAPLFAYTQGGGPGGQAAGDVDPAAYQKYLGDFGQAMVTPGQSGFGMSRQAAQQVLANPDFMAQLLGGTDSAQQEELLNLQHLQHPLASPLAQNYLNTQSTRLANRYTDASLGLLPGSSVNQYGGKFTNFLDQDEQGRALAQRLFGYVPR